MYYTLILNTCKNNLGFVGAEGKSRTKPPTSQCRDAECPQNNEMYIVNKH